MAALAAFLRRNFLVDRSEPGAARMLLDAKAGSKTHWASWLLHRYLFFRVPLVKPQRFLSIVEPLLAPVYSPIGRGVLLVLVLAGIYLVGRQWDAFVATFAAFGTWEGKAMLVAAILVSKILHELGHAVTLHRHGGRVPTMGVAFLVLFPVLYTDTSDCWRLRGRDARLAVGAGGILAELSLAAIALFLWSFAPEGAMRAALFVLAGTVWIGTLAINLNPFLRFDGYYLLSDWLDVANLQDRAFALARWRMREFLFGLGLPAPEAFSLGARHASCWPMPMPPGSTGPSCSSASRCWSIISFSSCSAFPCSRSRSAISSCAPPSGNSPPGGRNGGGFA